MPEHPRAKVWGIGTLVVTVGLLATAFALGGAGSGPSRTPAPAVLATPQAASSGVGVGAAGSVATHRSAQGARLAPAAPAPQFAPATGTAGASGDAIANGPVTEAVSGSSLAATRVVKTGDLTLSVDKNQVGATVTKLTELARRMGGYVSESRTTRVDSTPSGTVTLRVPVDKFDDAVAAAQQYGHTVSLATSAHDVTGKYVDLSARKDALERTRRTYLTILGRATTIGQTLDVQQRIEDVQQQIEQLQGQLKVLRNQSSDATLTVDVMQAGSPVVSTTSHHGGIGAAWHRSVDRFARGFDAIVAALGPILLALLVVGVLYGLGWFGIRRVRRAAG